MKRWFKSILVVLSCVTMAFGAGFCTPVQAQQTPPPQQAPSAQQPEDNDAKKQTSQKANHKGSDIELDSIIEDKIARNRSKVCTIQQTPAKISCVFAVTHAVGDPCTCKVGDSVREGRFLEP
jgi:hypothetical protein